MYPRVIALCASIAVSVLPVQARGAGAGVDKASLPAGVVATVGADHVKVEEFRSYCDLKGLRLGDLSAEEREALLKGFLVERLLAKEGRSRGLGDPGGFSAQIARFDRDVLPELLFQREFVSKAIAEEKDFESYFEGLNDLADLSVAVLASEPDARGFLDRVNGGEDFEGLVGKLSLGVSVQKAGLIPEVTPGDLRFTPEEKSAIFSGANGQVLGPFANRLGSYSLIKVLRRQTVEDQKKAIRLAKAQEVREMKAATAYLVRINDELVKSEIEINEEFFENREGAKRPYLAWVKGQYIYPQDLGVSADAGSHGARAYRNSLDKAIRAIVAADVARQEGMADLPEYRGKRDVFIMGEIVSRLLENSFRNAKVSASEKEIEKFYKENYQPDVYSLWLVVNASLDKVEEARREIRDGRDYAEVAGKYSDDPTRMKGGMTGYFPLSSLDGTTQKVIKALKGDEVSEAFRLGGKYAIIRVIERKTVPVPPLAELRDTIRQRILVQKRAKVVEDKRAGALRKETVRIDDAKLAEMK